MRKFNSNNKNINEIVYRGVNYFFISDKQGVGIRRKDNKIPHEGEVEAVTEYLFDEGWLNREDYEEHEPWKNDEI